MYITSGKELNRDEFWQTCGKIFCSNFDRDDLHISVRVYMLQKLCINSLP